MPQIEIDQEILDYLKKHVRDFGETPSSVLRRLLNMSVGQTNAESFSAELPQPEPAPRPQPEPQVRNRAATKTASNGPRIGSAIERYMGILSELYRQDPAKFKAVERIRGKKRLYFHTDRELIESTGNSLNPKRIPQTPYFATTNLSDEKKEHIMAEVLAELRVPYPQRELYLSRLRGISPSPPPTRTPDADSAEDDGLI